MTPQERKNFEAIRDNVHGDMIDKLQTQMILDYLVKKHIKQIDTLTAQLKEATQQLAEIEQSTEQEAIHLERLCRIMGTFDLASGHADTMDEALDSLESELRDVLGHYREALKNINTQCQNCASLETQNTELDAKLAAHEHERSACAVHAVDIARRAVAEEREACAKIADEWAVGWPHPSQVIAERIRARNKE